VYRFLQNVVSEIEWREEEGEGGVLVDFIEPLGRDHSSP